MLSRYILLENNQKVKLGKLHHHYIELSKDVYEEADLFLKKLITMNFIYEN